MKDNEFKCSMCDGVFGKGWSDEEADAEREESHGVSQNDCDLVCDDCWKKTPWGKNE